MDLLPEASAAIKEIPTSSFGLSKYDEFPMISLGHHHYLTRARHRMDELKLFPSIEELKDLVHSYSLPETSKKYRRSFLELKELSLPSKPGSVLAVCPPEEEKSIKEALQSTSIKHLSSGNNLKSVLQSLKKTKKPADTVVLDLGTEARTLVPLTIGLFVRPKNLILKLHDYVKTRSQIRLLYLLSRVYTKVSLSKPLVVPDVESIIYIVATGVRSTARACDEKLLVEKLCSVDRMHVVHAFPDLEVPSDYIDGVSTIQRKFIAREIKGVTSLHDVVKSKDFYGATREAFLQKKTEMEKQWLESYSKRD